MWNGLKMFYLTQYIKKYHALWNQYRKSTEMFYFFSPIKSLKSNIVKHICVQTNHISSFQ